MWKILFLNRCFLQNQFLTNFEEVIAKNRFSSFSTFWNNCPVQEYNAYFRLLVITLWEISPIKFLIRSTGQSHSPSIFSQSSKSVNIKQKSCFDQMYFSLFPIFNCGCPQYSIEGELSGNLARVVERSIPRQTFEHLQPPVLSKMAIISIYWWATYSRNWAQFANRVCLLWPERKQSSYNIEGVE